MIEVASFPPGRLPAATAMEIYEFRYRIFVEEQGYSDPHARHGERVIRDPLDDCAHQITARREGALIGVGRVNFLNDARNAEIERIYRLADLGADYPDRVAVTTRLMIDEAHRGGFAAADIMMEGFRIMSRRPACDWCVAICRPELTRFFRKIGFEIHARDIVHPDFGRRDLIRYNLRQPPIAKSRIARLMAEAAGGGLGAAAALPEPA